ncbi:hypothetical protein L1887_23272 [Cichorium endivia]|nr:hypothetical protein L1887_23272 [Cichorium endivia]
MDANRSGDHYRWTNERHLHFLKSVEASFVRTMLKNNNRRVLLRMDRYLPDSCESTLDSTTTTTMTGTKRRKRHFPSDNLIDQRRLRLHPSSTHQNDQVVPQIKHIKTEEDDDNWTNSP